MGRRPFYAEGTLAQRPPARRPGLLWKDTDTGEVYYDDGSTWIAVGGGGGAGQLVYSGFKPGTLGATGQFHELRDPNPGGQVSLLVFEAYLQAPPENLTDAYLWLDITSSVGGSWSIALNVNGQSRFTEVPDPPTVLEGDIRLWLSTSPGTLPPNPGGDLQWSFRVEPV